MKKTIIFHFLFVFLFFNKISASFSVFTRFQRKESILLENEAQIQTFLELTANLSKIRNDLMDSTFNNVSKIDVYSFSKQIQTSIKQIQKLENIQIYDCCTRIQRTLKDNINKFEIFYPFLCIVLPKHKGEILLFNYIKNQIDILHLFKRKFFRIFDICSIIGTFIQNDNFNKNIPKRASHQQNVVNMTHLIMFIFEAYQVDLKFSICVMLQYIMRITI